MHLDQCCLPCGFPANLGLCFRGFAVFFKTSGLVAFGLVSIKICLFFGLIFCRFLFCGLFFSNFMALLLFQFTAERILGGFLCKFAQFGLVFQDLPGCFCI